LREALAQSAKAGWIGVPALVWVSLALFNSIRTALSAVFGMRETEAFWKYILKDIFLLCTFTGALLLVNVFPLALAAVVAWLTNTFPRWDAAIIAQVSPILLSKTLLFVLLAFVYRFAPNAKPAWSLVLTSAFVYTVLLALVRAGFGWYVGNYATYNVIYGIYATVVAVAFWLYYTALALLFSAEIASHLIHPRRQTKAGNYVIHEPHR
jgi:membrane protein